MENKKTILLVDDEVKITQVLTAYLEKAGYQTVCAHDGKEASRLLQSQSFSLIILDLMLPDISGESLCRTIRTHYRTPVNRPCENQRKEHHTRGILLRAGILQGKINAPQAS